MVVVAVAAMTDKTLLALILLALGVAASAIVTVLVLEIHRDKWDECSCDECKMARGRK